MAARSQMSLQSLWSGVLPLNCCFQLRWCCQQSKWRRSGLSSQEAQFLKKTADENAGAPQCVVAQLPWTHSKQHLGHLTGWGASWWL
eukprot:5999882-Pleurochrysis_carterae.AAC.2